jgi:hypothetical protein
MRRPCRVVAIMSVFLEQWVNTLWKEYDTEPPATDSCHLHQYQVAALNTTSCHMHTAGPPRHLIMQLCGL